MHFRKLTKIMMMTSLITLTIPNCGTASAYSVDNLSVAEKIETRSNIEETSVSDAEMQAVKEYNVLMDNYEKNDNGDLNYPDYYAGAYVNDEGELVVFSTSGNKENSKKILKDAENDDLKIEEKKYSYNELLELKTSIEEKVTNATENSKLLNSILTIGIDDMSNKVVVTVLNLSNVEQKQLKDILGNTDKLSIQNKSDEILPQTTSLSAGMRTYYAASEGYNWLYSIGYKAFRLTSSGEYEYGFVTAAHSNDVGCTMKYGSDEIGTITSRTFDGSVDASFVKITNSEYSMSNDIYYTNNVASGTHYISYIPVGATIYKVGATTQLTSGEVTNSSLTVCYDDHTLSDFIETSLPSNGGDSGGLVYAPYDDAYLVVGILDAANSTSSYICKCGNIESTMGVYIY